MIAAVMHVGHVRCLIETEEPMTDVALTADEEKIWELHRGFIDANKTGFHPFLEEHMAPGMTLVWYNLNQSNDHGVDHIVELWKMLAAG